MGRRARRATPHTSEVPHVARYEATQVSTGLPGTLVPQRKCWIVLADQELWGHGHAQLLRAGGRDSLLRTPRAFPSTRNFLVAFDTLAVIITDASERSVVQRAR
jgi:hypothetical protein